MLIGSRLSAAVGTLATAAPIRDCEASGAVAPQHVGAELAHVPDEGVHGVVGCGRASDRGS